ncbi:MAG: DUF3857 domain-containing transglutaminase family protein [Lysobacterales bacterium]
MFAVARAAFAALLCVFPAGLAAASDVQRFERGEFAFEYGPPEAFVERVEVAGEWPADAPGAQGASWRNWLIDEQADFRGSEPVRFHENVIETRSETLLATAARFEISFNPAFERLRLHAVEVRRDGVWSDRFNPESVTLARREGEFESDMATGRVSALVLVADVRLGDQIRYAYSVTGENPILRGMTHRAANLGWIDPILHRQVRLHFPPGMELDHRVFGEAPAPEISRSPQGISLRWGGSALAANPMEEDAPSWHNQQPLIEVAGRRDWQAVSTWAGGLYPMDQALPGELEALVEEWQRLPDAQSRAAAALRTVQEDVRYFSVLMGESSHRPTPPAETWQRRYGDCKDKAWLLSVLLVRMGIEAEPALVSSTHGRALDRSLPAASQFDHVIVRAKTGDEVFWLDATRSLQRGPLAMRQSSDFGFALPVHSTTEGLVDMASLREQRATQHVVERFMPSADGTSVRLEIETTLSGTEAERRRHDFRSRELSEISRSYVDYYTRLHGELASTEAIRFEDDPESGEIRIFEAYLLQRPWVSSGSGSRVLEIHADLMSPYLGLSGPQQRRHPLWRPHPIELRQTTEVVLPEGWSMLTTPDSVDAEDASFRYARRIRREADRLVVDHRFNSLAEQVAAADAPRHFELRRRAIEAVGARLQFSLPTASANRERNQRLRALLGKPAN